jgi:hypothetical protein
MSSSTCFTGEVSGKREVLVYMLQRTGEQED